MHRATMPMVMLASGFAGLGYQIVWTQQCAVWLGHEAAAVLAVVTAFFGGLAVGAWTLAPRIERSSRPERWYAGCEIIIALWSLALAALMERVGAWAIALTGAQPSAGWQWTVAFAGTFLVLLPATLAMGATLPAMERVLARRRGPVASIAGLYAANTAGAVVGVLAAAFWLVPAFGLQRTAAVCAALNLLCAALSLTFTSNAPAVPARSSMRFGPGTAAPLALTGLLGIGYEVLVVRVVSQTTENTVYTFAMLLAVYLVGTALGAAAYQRWLARRPDAVAWHDRLLLGVAAACLAGTASLWMAESWRDAARAGLGPGMASAVAAEAMLALAAFALPTLAMGALFSHLCTRARDQGMAFGRSLAVNTLGAASAPTLFGVLLLPMLGAKFALLLIAAGYLSLTSARIWRGPAVWLTAGAAAVLALATPALVFISVPEGGRVVSYREGVMAAVSVVEDAHGVSRLRIDNRQQEGSSASRVADGRQALLPLLLQAAPRHALFLGLGTGVTASAAAEDPSVQVDAVELLPEVIEASAHFTDSNPRLHLMAADARRFVRSAGAPYDVIVSDNFHPARSGSGALYTVEHFRAVRARLGPSGVFCQWLPLHQLDLETLRSIVRSYVEVFPDAVAMLATNSLETPVIGLVARADDGRFDADALRQRLAGLPSRDGYGLVDEYAVLGSIVAGPHALAAFAGDAPLNTDDRPVVAYAAPRITYAPDSSPSDRLSALLHRLSDERNSSAEWLTADDLTQRRLSNYRAARDRFIDAGRGVRPLADPRAMLAAVREPLLAVLRISPDFRPAYDPLLRLAMAAGRSDAPAARALLAELVHLQPGRPEAAQALATMP